MILGLGNYGKYVSKKLKINTFLVNTYFPTQTTVMKSKIVKLVFYYRINRILNF